MINMDENTTKIILAIIGIVTILVSGALISIKRIKKRESKNSISNITIKGNRNKLVGGNDNSKN
jgi:hypothetical protein